MQDISDDALIEGARALVPNLRERATACEALRRLPEETMAELRDAHLFRTLQPRAFGGLPWLKPWRHSPPRRHRHICARQRGAASGWHAAAS